MELLEKNNILLNCKAKEKAEVIREIGHILMKSGYIEESYIDSMLEKETVFSTNIGNGIAIPHGMEAGKKNIKKSGLAVMVFPEGTKWNDEYVKVVIGIASAGEEHLDILANIAMNLSSEEEVNALASKSVDEIYRIFTGQ